MRDYKIISGRLKSILGMKSEPVGIRFLGDNNLSDGFNKSEKYTFCQFIMRAREGNMLLASADTITCPNGSSALGFTPVPEKLMNGDFLHQLGTFTKEGAKTTMEMMPRFRQHQYSGILLAPLEIVNFDPDIIVLETAPEHLMWLGLACIHKKGGRLQFSSGISNGTCVDITIVPHLTQTLNVSLGCYGCRNATSIPVDHLIAGFPGSQIDDILDSLQALSEKAMPRTREKKAYERLISTQVTKSPET